MHGGPVAADGVGGFFGGHAESHAHVGGHGRELAQFVDAGHALLASRREQPRQLLMGQGQFPAHAFDGGFHLVVLGGQVAGRVAHAVDGLGGIGHGAFELDGGAYRRGHGKGGHDGLHHLAAEFLAAILRCLCLRQRVQPGFRPGQFRICPGLVMRDGFEVQAVAFGLDAEALVRPQVALQHLPGHVVASAVGRQCPVRLRDIGTQFGCPGRHGCLAVQAFHALRCGADAVFHGAEDRRNRWT